MAPQKEEFERRAKAREIQRLEAQREHQAAATAQLEEHRLATLKVFEIKEARLHKWQANEAARYQVCRAGLEPRTSRPESQPDSQAETLVGTDYRPGLCSSATHAFDPWLGQELIRNSRDSEQGVGKRLQMAFINLAEKQLTDAEKALERRLAGEQRNARLEAERVRASEIKRRKMEMKQARQTTALRSASRI